jgi:hypothetical protein
MPMDVASKSTKAAQMNRDMGEDHAIHDVASTNILEELRVLLELEDVVIASYEDLVAV